jgi:hypothetical protein
MKAIATDNLTKMFGQLVAANYISSNGGHAFSERWRLTDRERDSDLNEVQPNM